MIKFQNVLYNTHNIFIKCFSTPYNFTNLSKQLEIIPSEAQKRDTFSTSLWCKFSMFYLHLPKCFSHVAFTISYKQQRRKERTENDEKKKTGIGEDNVSVNSSTDRRERYVEFAMAIRYVGLSPTFSGKHKCGHGEICKENVRSR